MSINDTFRRLKRASCLVILPIYILYSMYMMEKLDVLILVWRCGPLVRPVS